MAFSYFFFFDGPLHICLNGTSTVDEWTNDFLQTGDIVEELRIGNLSQSKSAFKKGKGGVQKTLHKSFKKKETLILIRVRRGVDEFAELQACIMPNDSVSQKKGTCLCPSLNPALSPFEFSLNQQRAEQGTDLQGFNNGCHGFLIQRKRWETFEFLDLMILFGFENFGGFGLFFLWVSDPIFINDSFSLSHNSTNLDFLYLFPKKIYGYEG